MLDRIRKQFETKLGRLKMCFWGLEFGTVICSLLDKIFTFVAITYHGASERNMFGAAQLVNWIGVGPAAIVGFFFTILPLILIHYGIRRFKWDKEMHYWIYTLFMTVYFAIFFKLVESEIKWFGRL